MVKARFLVSLMLVLSFSLVVGRVFAAGNDEAQDAINTAASRVVSAYKSVLEAEAAGANVSTVLLRLNDGSTLLSKAQMQYQIGNFSEAVSFANLCFDSLNRIEVEANSLRDGAVMEREQRLLVASVGSAFAIFAVVYAGIYGWRFFKKRYYKQVLDMRPEVQANDSG